MVSILCELQHRSQHNPFLSAPQRSEMFVHSCVDGLSIFFSGVFTPPHPPTPRFHSSREAAPVLPSLFTLLFSSIYSALQHPGAQRSKQLLHYGERGSSDCAAPPHSSLSIPPSLSLTAHHGCASTPFHCHHKARPPFMPAWLPGAARARATVREGLRKPQKDKLAKFGF